VALDDVPGYNSLGLIRGSCVFERNVEILSIARYGYLPAVTPNRDGAFYLGSFRIDH
jgi:hypothetical protein